MRCSDLEVEELSVQRPRWDRVWESLPHGVKVNFSEKKYCNFVHFEC